MSQRDQKFTPRVLPVVVGTKVVFPNDDRVFHNVFSLSKTKHFDLGVYGKGKTKDETFPKTGLVRIHCNIHSKMVATVLVLANPYFAVSDATGLYVITGIPDGEHTMRAWHEFGGGASRQLELRGGSVVEHSFEVRETKKTLPHKNKFGRPYRQKY